MSRIDHLTGGKGDYFTASDVDPYELQKGIEVEMEHTFDPELAEEIALDHLAEDPMYYTKLKTIHTEKKMKIKVKTYNRLNEDRHHDLIRGTEGTDARKLLVALFKELRKIPVLLHIKDRSTKASFVVKQAYVKLEGMLIKTVDNQNDVNIESFSNVETSWDGADVIVFSNNSVDARIKIEITIRVADVSSSKTWKTYFN